MLEERNNQQLNSETDSTPTIQTESGMDDELYYSQINSMFDTKIETEKPESRVVPVYYIPWVERIILPQEDLLDCYAATIC